MMALRHDDMMERSPLPPQAGNTRFSYNDRGAHWESSGRRNEKMMISGRANSMSPPLGVSSKMAKDLSPPPHQYFAISARQLQQSDFCLDALRSKADSPQRHLFKHLLQLVEIAKAQFHDVARPLFHPSSLLRHEPLGIGDGRRHKQVDTHLAVIRQVQVGALYLLHPDVDAHRLCKAKHLDGQRDRHGFPIHIAYIDRFVKVAGHIFL